MNGKIKIIKFTIPSHYEYSPFLSDQNSNSKIFIYPDSSLFYISQGPVRFSPNYGNIEAAINYDEYLMREDSIFFFQSIENGLAWKEIRIQNELWFGYANVRADMIKRFDKGINNAMPNLKRKKAKK